MVAPAGPGPACRRFDRIVVVDWSAASAPRLGRDSIWIAVAVAGAHGTTVENVPTRREAERHLAALVADAGDRRTLLGVDFSLGYPAGTADALGLPGPPWRAMWRHLATEVDDDERNRNNRFAVAGALNRRLGRDDGPFWGRPAAQAVDGLPTTKPRAPSDVGLPDPATPSSSVVSPLAGRAVEAVGAVAAADRGSSSVVSLPEWRAVEVALRAVGRRPFSAWQLLGAGCVGSQTLVGIPVLERLRARFAERVRVWPFTTGLVLPEVRPGDTVVAEVWPSLIGTEPRSGQVRDAAQVEALAGALAELDRTGGLAPSFAPVVDDAVAAAVVTEEGWVLGVGGLASGPAGAVPTGVDRPTMVGS